MRMVVHGAHRPEFKVRGGLSLASAGGVGVCCHGYRSGSLGTGLHWVLGTSAMVLHHVAVVWRVVAGRSVVGRKPVGVRRWGRFVGMVSSGRVRGPLLPAGAAPTAWASCLLACHPSSGWVRHCQPHPLEGVQADCWLCLCTWRLAAVLRYTSLGWLCTAARKVEPVLPLWAGPPSCPQRAYRGGGGIGSRWM
jgi:hypothetical protein